MCRCRRWSCRAKFEYSIHRKSNINTKRGVSFPPTVQFSLLLLASGLLLLLIRRRTGWLLVSRRMGFHLSPASSARKWLGFVTAVWVQSISGNNYTFSNYSDALKSLMALTQLELNNLSVAKDVGKAFGILAGLASDRFPTPVILLIGSIEGLVGYGVQWLVVSQKIQPLPYWQVCILTEAFGKTTNAFANNFGFC